MKWIEFHELSIVGRKSRSWEVVTKDGHVPLGEVKWFGRWRGYAFFPRPATVFEPTCLDDISSFIRERMVEHRAAAKKTTPNLLLVESGEKI